MWLTIAYSVLLVTSLAVMFAQLIFKPVRTEHILLAIFSGSLAMVAMQQLTAESGSSYQYVFALGTCATCNVIWLLSRALFSGGNSLSLKHYLVAVSIALLVVTNRSLDLLVSVDWLIYDDIHWLKRAIAEITQMLSSTTLALSFWEALNGYKKASKTSQYQRVIFASVFFTCVFSCTVIAHGVLSESASQIIKPWLVVFAALAITLTTFMIVVWQHKARAVQKMAEEQGDAQENSEEQQLFGRLQQLMWQDKRYLQADLKIIDLAIALNVSEYKVSRIIRNMTPCSNSNQFINQYRLEHAKQLLTASHSRDWTILVISLESGFASLAPFNRAFKAAEGCTPNQYRMQHQITVNENKSLPA